MHLSSQFEQALHYAVLIHAGQIRKYADQEAAPAPTNDPAAFTGQRDRFNLKTFTTAIQMLLGLATKPSEKFVGTGYGADDLEMAAKFIKKVAAKKRATAAPPAAAMQPAETVH
jgi:hypothetical protein